MTHARRWCLAGLILLLAPQVVWAQLYPGSTRTQPAQESRYEESALRRFEIITLSSLPFTMIESFLVVRGVEMVSQSQFSPELTNRHYAAAGLLAVSASSLIGLWDWMHTRGKDTSQPKIPRRPPIPGFNPIPPSQPRTNTSADLTLTLVSARF